MYLNSAGFFDSSNIDKLKVLIGTMWIIDLSENINCANIDNNEKGKINAT